MTKTLTGRALFTRFFSILPLLALPLASMATPSISADEKQAGIFQLGKVTNNPLKQNKRMQPMADLLATQLGYEKGLNTFTQNVQDMQQKMQRSEVDLFTGSAYEAGVLIHSGVGEALALKSKEGKKDYRAIIVVRLDSSIQSVDQLGGKAIAFEDTDSTSAYRVPYIELSKAGFTLTEKHGKPRNNKHIHYRFSGSEQNSSALLYRGLVDAIALSDADWNKRENVPGFQKKQFRIIFTSQPIPRALEVVRSTLDEKTKNRLQQILLNLHKNEETEPVMALYHKTKEFSSVTEDTLQYLRELGEYFKE